MTTEWKQRQRSQNPDAWRADQAAKKRERDDRLRAEALMPHVLYAVQALADGMAPDELAAALVSRGVRVRTGK